jgi:hypothetical protein
MTPPAVVYPSPNEWPNSVRAITNITNAANAVVESALHGFVAADQGKTIITFHSVKGMIQINGLPGTVVRVIDPNYFTVNINTTDFFSYVSGGQFCIVAGLSPYDPFQNIK